MERSMVHGRRTLTVCPAGWRGIVYRYCRDLERGERLVDNGLVPRLLISWRRCVSLLLFLLFFFPPAHRRTPGVDQMGWKRLCALLASRSARAKQGFFSQIFTWRRKRSVVWSMGAGFGTRAWRGSAGIDGYARVPHEVERRCDYWAEFLIARAERIFLRLENFLSSDASNYFILNYWNKIWRNVWFGNWMWSFET